MGDLDSVEKMWISFSAYVCVAWSFYRIAAYLVFWARTPVLTSGFVGSTCDEQWENVIAKHMFDKLSVGVFWFVFKNWNSFPFSPTIMLTR